MPNPNLRALGTTYPEKILQLLQNSSLPLAVEQIRIGTGIGNWNTALKHCLELTVEGKIKAMKTGNGWIFWVEKKTEK